MKHVKTTIGGPMWHLNKTVSRYLSLNLITFSSSTTPNIVWNLLLLHSTLLGVHVISVCSKFSWSAEM